MTRLSLGLVILIGWTLPALADGCYICTSGSGCGQYCRYAGADNADNRSEQTDERRVVAKRSEVRETSFELHALQRQRSSHRFFRRFRPAISFHEPRLHHRRFRRR